MSTLWFKGNVVHWTFSKGFRNKKAKHEFVKKKNKKKNSIPITSSMESASSTHTIDRNENVIVAHLPLLPHICVSEYSEPSHYLNKCWVIVNWTTKNTLQWNFNQNTNLFIHDSASENIVCETAVILSRGRWVNDVFLIGWNTRNGITSPQNINMLYSWASCDLKEISSTQQFHSVLATKRPNMNL